MFYSTKIITQFCILHSGCLHHQVLFNPSRFCSTSSRPTESHKVKFLELPRLYS